MNPPEFPAGGGAPPWFKKEIPLQGPWPPPLRVSKTSHKIKKAPPAPAELASQQQRKPVIIYSLPPKVIHVAASEFKDIVQRLTGLPPSYEQSAGPGDVSPAARLASIEKTSSTEMERLRSRDDTNHTIRELKGMEMAQFPGILSPAPATLPPVSSEYFSPAADFRTLPVPHELSPFCSGNSFPQTLSFQQELNPFQSGNSFPQTLPFQQELNPVRSGDGLLSLQQQLNQLRSGDSFPQTLPFQQELNQSWSGYTVSQTLSFKQQLIQSWSENSFPQTSSFQQELNQSWTGNSFPQSSSFQQELNQSSSGNSFPQTPSIQQELNPSLSENSPLGLLSGSTVSPIPSPDEFNPFD